MSDSNRFCHRCGAELPAGSAFCPRCGNPVAATGPPGAGAPPPSQPEPTDWREQRRQWRAQRRAERDEKYEKQEKQEKNEKNEKGGRGNIIGPIIGGSILVWLGITFYLQQIGTFPSSDWWAYFIVGIGVIIIIQGIILYAQHRRPFIGPLIGGAVLLFVGLSFIYNAWANFWPLILVVIGIAIVGSALAAQRRTPKPV